MGLYESLGIDLFGPRTLRQDRVDIKHILAFEPLFIDHLLDFLARIYVLCGPENSNGLFKPSLAPCSQRSRSLLAACGGGLRPTLTAAARGAHPDIRVGKKEKV